MNRGIDPAEPGAPSPAHPLAHDKPVDVPELVRRDESALVTPADELGESPSVAGPAIESLPAGPISRQVVLLALPMLGEQIGIFVVGLVDTYLAGRVSKEATAAVGTASYMAWFFQLAFSLVGVGATALVSRAFGARDVKLADRTLNQGFLAAAAFGLLSTVVVYATAPFFVRQIMVGETVQHLSTLYLRIDSLGYALFSLNMLGSAVLRGAGDTRTPMLIMVVVNVVNAVVSAALVFGWLGEPRGVAGIAIGTVVARCLGGAIMTMILVRGLRGLRLQSRLLRLDFGMQRRLLRVGLPAAADSAAMWAAHIGFIWVIWRTAQGDAATVNFAAHSIAMRAEAIGYLPAFAWGTAAATLVGQYLGAGRPADARHAGHTAAVQGLALALVAGLLFYFGADQIYRVMIEDPAVQEVGGRAFRFVAFAQPFLGLAIIYICALRGAGDTRWTMLLAAVGGLGIRIPLAYLCGVVLEGGLIGAWCGMWGDNVVRFALALGRFAHGGWQRVRV